MSGNPPPADEPVLGDIPLSSETTALSDTPGPVDRQSTILSTDSGGSRGTGGPPKSGRGSGRKTPLSLRDANDKLKAEALRRYRLKHGDLSLVLSLVTVVFLHNLLICMFAFSFT